MMNKGRAEIIWRAIKVVEANLLRLMILAAVVLLVSQLWPVNPAEQMLGSSAELEDLMAPASKAASDEKEVITQTPYLTLELQGVSALAKATVLVNGAKVADFADKTVTVRVQSGDVVGIDGSFYHRTALVKVMHSSPQVKYPQEGQEIVVNSRLVSLKPVVCDLVAR